jgi:1-deoxy-D-xylulose-5-phosphate synthase
MMYTASIHESEAWAIRYPRGNGVGMPLREGFEPVEIGKGVCLRQGEDVAVLTFGPIADYAEEAMRRAEDEGIIAGHYDMRFVKPLDEELLECIAARYKAIVTVEDGTVVGGFGSAVSEFFADRDTRPAIHRIGVPDRIIEHGTQRELHDEAGMGPDAILQAVRTAHLKAPADLHS